MTQASEQTGADAPAQTLPWAERADDALRRLDADADVGLTSVEAAKRLERHGPNELVESTGPGAVARLLAQFVDPLVLLLLAAIVVSMFAWWSDGAGGLPVEAIVIAAIIVANAIIGFWQEGRAIDAVAALRRLSAPRCTIVRDGIATPMLTRHVVPGDIAVLAEGDAVGFDGRLVEAASLEVVEAALTGESLPVRKHTSALDRDTAVADRSNSVFSGTAIARGRGRALVTATGTDTEVGHIADLVGAAVQARTPLQRQIDRLGRVLGLGVVIIAALLVIAIAVSSTIDSADDVVDALLVAVSLAVAAVPEGLPAILTVVLALGVQRMARRNAIVKRLLSVETLGSASVICTDKTGTLTRNEMTVVRLATASGVSRLSGVGYEPFGELSMTKSPESPFVPNVVRSEVEMLLVAAAGANDATLQVTSADDWSVSGDPTEIALLVAAAKLGADQLRSDRYRRMDEIPFDAERRLMTTLDEDSWSGSPDHREAADTIGRYLQWTKGAPDALIQRCTGERRNGRVEPLTELRLIELADVIDSFADDGLRTLAMAYRSRADVPVPFDETSEHDLVLLGVVAIADPPRTEVADVIADANRAGIRVVMLTGDHPRTASAIAGSLAIAGSDHCVVTGSAVAESSEAELGELVTETQVFARVAPEHKLRIVEAFQRQGHVVAMTGDGVNDAPALRKADIGVAMGLNGTDVARDAADLILADDDFATIVRAVREGREIFDDIRKFLRYLLASNTGEVLVMIVGVLAAGVLGLADAGEGLAVPLLATQILWINLLTDSALALALGVDPSVDDVMRERPRRLDDPIIDRAMWVTVMLVGSVTAIVGLVALDLELSGGLLGGDGDLTTARTMLFTTVVLAQIFNAFNARSDRISAFVQPFGNRLLLAAAALTVALQVAVVHLAPLNRAFDTTALDVSRWLVCVGLASLVLVADELRKLVVRSRTPHPSGASGHGA